MSEDYKKQYRDAFFWLSELWLAVKGDRDLDETMEYAYNFICSREGTTTNGDEVFAKDDIPDLLGAPDGFYFDPKPKESLVQSMEWVVGMMNEGNADPREVYPSGRYQGD